MKKSAAMKNEKRVDTKKTVTLSVMTAMAYIAVFFIRIPAVEFLKYEPKDVIITIGGFMFGPLASLLMSLVVSLLEMVTISTTGPIGALMNFISTTAFACTAAVVYKKLHSLKGAVIGLAAGTVLMTAVMLAWNYLVTPVYMGTPREVMSGMLLPVFLPFNLVKAVLNSTITMLVYKPLSNIMKKARVLPEMTHTEKRGGRCVFVHVIAAFVLLTCIAVFVIWNLK